MIQPLAYIHPQARIADNVVIEPFVTIHKDVEIGEGTWECICEIGEQSRKVT